MSHLISPIVLVAAALVVAIVLVILTWSSTETRYLRERLQLLMADNAEQAALIRTLYDRLDQARVDHANVALRLRRDGFQAGGKATITEAPDPESEGLARAEAQLIQRQEDVVFVRNMAGDIVKKTGVSEAQAMAEAWRIRRELSMEDPPT